MAAITAFINDKRVVFLCRVAVAIVFISFAASKAEMPRDFAKYIQGYHLLPDFLINISAVLLPGIEIITGITLLIGLFARNSSAIIISLLIIFMAAFGTSTIIYGKPPDCGCSWEHVNILEFYLRDTALLIGALITFNGKHILSLDNLYKARKQRQAIQFGNI